MATRFWFQSSGTIASPNNPSFDAGWEQTGQATRVPMTVKAQTSEVTALTNSSAITIPITTTQQILAWQCTSDQVFLPVILDASVTFSMVIRCSENANTNNAFLAYVLRAFSAAGDRSLGTLASSMTNTGTEFPLTASAATRIFSNIALTLTTIAEPWRLVIEIGAHAQAPSAAGSYIERVGCNNASDFALTSGLTTDLNPWMELSANLDKTEFNNYQAPTSGGLSIGTWGGR